MTYKNFPLITSHPEVFGGKPSFLDTRISVEQVLQQLANGESEAEILKDYPKLTPKHISQALWFSAQLASFEFSVMSYA